ncbi:HlyD family efflux transporter periplasmic adaptor subunit [Dechloromonas sp. HYN0024]|nr:HlyD family efflux transporter periplasmic adaptor subunit [Dechloromonas sp. HYN0024]
MKNLSITYWMLLFFICLILWASLFDINQSVRALGQIVPSTTTQIIQAADGGVLEKILVKEGQVVKAGQVLARLEKNRASANVDEGQSRAVSLSAALIRARAEANEEAPVFGKALKRFPDAVAEQKSLYEQKKKGLEADLANLREALVLAQDELKINEKLFATGDIGQLELIRAKRQITDLKGRINSTRNKYLQDARQEATKLQEELASQRFKLEERESVLFHTALTAPVAGVVKSLRLNTVGGVLRAGDELMQISPTDVGLLVEVKVMPADVGLLHIGLPVSVKIDAFDYSVYGALNGKLDYISSDTLTEQGPTGQAITYYKARIQLIDDHANKKLNLSELKAGMTASADIQTGERSVLQYLFKPIAKAFQGAATER